MSGSMVTVILLSPVLLATGITDSESRVNEAGQEIAGDLAPLMWTVLILTAIFFVFRFVMGWIKTALSEDKSVAEIRAQLAKDRASGLVPKPKALESSEGQAPPVAVRTPPHLPPSRTPVRDNRASYRLLSVAGGAEHQIARAASYLDRWMWQRRNHFPRTGRLPLVDAPTSRLASLPVVTGVTTDLVRTWSKAERKRLFRVVHADAWENGHGFLEVPVDDGPRFPTVVNLALRTFYG